MQQDINIKKFRPFIRRAKYYETDKMGIIHHSNYIRWFEESRIDFLEQIGLGFDQIEAAGLYCPVLGVACEYKYPVRFNEDVIILPKLESFNGIKMTIVYRVLDAKSRQIRVTGTSEHCFVSTDFKPVSLKKDFRDMYDVLLKWTGAEITL